MNDNATRSRAAVVREWTLRVLVALCVVAILLLATLGVTAAPTQAPKKTTSPTPAATATVRRTPTPGFGTVAPTASAQPGLFPTATSTRPAKPPTNLVLVPLTVRLTNPPAGLPPGTGAIVGRVVEATGRGIWGLVIKVTKADGAWTAETRDDGGYEILGFEPGVYSVVVEGQICTPAEGVRLEAGQAVQVDFAQIRAPGAVPARTTTGTPAGTATPTATPTATRTPLPPTATPTMTATPTPRPPAASMFDVSRWWTWLGFDIDLSELASHLYLGVMGGFLVFAVGIVLALMRR